MISKQVATQVLEQCLITGGDFAEIFEEDCINNNLSLIDSKIENEFGNYYRALNLLYTAAEIEDTSTMYTAASKNDAKIGIVKNLLALGKIEEAGTSITGSKIGILLFEEILTF